MYFAIGRRVLRQPAGNLVYMVSWPAKDRSALPVVMHPDEPEGCPDHPIQQAVYHLSHVSAVSKDQSGDASHHADAVSVIVHDGTPYTRNTLFERMCQVHPLRDFSNPGFVGCRKAYSCDKAGAYQATDYSAPDGTKIALDCNTRMYDCTTNQLNQCSGGYLLRDHFTVNFSFSVAFLPIGELPFADQEVRQRLDEAEVKDFEWAP